MATGQGKFICNKADAMGFLGTNLLPPALY
jgi:hypothetical protein